MEEKNPLELTAVTLPEISQTSNERGRPSSKKAIKFTPQPKSIISRFLRRIREENCDKIKGIGLHKTHEISNCNQNIESGGIFNIKVDSITEERLQGHFSLEGDHDNFKDSCFLGSREQNNYQTSTDTLWNMKCEKEPKLLEIVCYVCSHRSSSQQAHRKHLSIHRNQPYTCNFPNCKYSCKLSCNLIKHKRIHTSEKPYLCDQCTFRSNFANSLKVHKRIHTSDRPYGCRHCSYRCNSSSNLKKHCLHKHRNVS